MEKIDADYELEKFRLNFSRYMHADRFFAPLTPGVIS